MDSETQIMEAAAPSRYRRGGDSNAHNTIVLGPRDSLVGKLTVDGDVRVLGNLEGELVASGDVHVEGTVKAGIEARNVSVRGQVTGDVTAKERLLLSGSGSLDGNVKIARLSIEDGATLNGNVTMTPRGGRGRGDRGEGEGQGEGQPEGQPGGQAEGQQEG